MKILIGCEESGTVTNAFRKKGCKAFSCDLEPTRGNPDWHYQADIMEIIPLHYWDLILLHPDCTKLAVSGNRWYGSGMPRNDERVEAVKWTVKLWSLACQHSKSTVLENPVSVIFQFLDAPVQYIQPWQFGHGETKKTGLALRHVPPLKPTKLVCGREQRVWKMGPSPTRKRDRSKTFDGIASAMATQWSEQ